MGMENSTKWKEHFSKELETAISARDAGKEGMARVCARRAAGILSAEYLQKRSIPDPGPSAISRLTVLASLEEISIEVKDIIGHLIMRVNRDHTLPIEIDLIAETIWLEKELYNLDDVN